jgi:hypothetical protein
VSTSRAYSDRTLKILWGRSAGRCAVPDCRVELLVEQTEWDPVVIIGDIAHIEASSDSGPRANRDKTTKERDDYENLILLCRNCHARLDGQKETNTVEHIRSLKEAHEAWVRASLPERGRSRTGWNAIILQGAQPIDLSHATTALAPDYAIGDPEIVEADPTRRSWSEIRTAVESQVGGLFLAADPFEARFAAFPLAPVSACISLGYVLTNRPRVRGFQYHRDVQSWAWQPDTASRDGFTVDGVPKEPVESGGDLAIAVSLSATVTKADVEAVTNGLCGYVSLSTTFPTAEWLKEERQLREFEAEIAAVVEQCLRSFPSANTWHLFCAVPAPAAVAIGQHLNPTMTPRVCLYEYSRSSSPRYSLSICLGGTE